MKYQNSYPMKGLIFKSRPSFEQMPNRKIITNKIDFDTCTNIIRTSKYTALNFVPLNLFFQFSKIANLYFLMIGIMQMIPEISISGGMPVIFMPLSFVIIVSAIKDLMQDFKRRDSDKQLNQKNALVLTSSGFINRKWKELRIGEIIKVNQNQQIPADVIILNSSQEKHNCYIQTKNLDGETNLKQKLIQYELAIKLQNKNDLELFNTNIQFSYEKPNPYIYTFSGSFQNQKTRIGLDNNNVVLRGCSLRITKWIIGLVIYTGYDTKIMLNSNKTRQKKSRLEFKMGIIVAVIFFTQMILTFLSALFSASWSHNYLDLYLYLKNNAIFLYKNQIFKRWGSWILLFTNFVPISLIVSLQMVKFIQGIFISKFRFSTQRPSEIVVQSSNLNQQLGQIQHFFSDKTGTLTCNYMNFKYLVVNGKTFGDGDPLSQKQRKLLQTLTNVDFTDRKFLEQIQSKVDDIVFQFIICLCLCHSVIVEQIQQGKIRYNASSPDELAFINFAKFCGFEFKGVNKNNQKQIWWGQKRFNYKQLHTIEFNSDRKRMSVIVQYNNKIFLYSKGADNKILEKLRIKKSLVINQTNQKLKQFSVQGLRTLLFAKKQIQKSVYEKWSKLYVNALTKLQTIEQQEKKKIKQLAIKKSRLKQAQGQRSSMIKHTGIQRIGMKIIQAQPQLNDNNQQQEIIPADNLILTQNQRKFVKQHRRLQEQTNKSAQELQDFIEQGLNLLGASAVEDKLQDNVKQTIQSLREAGIKVWMLTGDKLETAINIGYSCGIIDQNMQKLIFTDSPQKTLQRRERIQKEVCLVISGEQLLGIRQSNHKELLALIHKCKSIIACRVTPKQKQEMVSLLRKSKHTTLAIGDGANDVNMINMAHVGVGIKGVEGAQAAQCSDYAITEFQMIRQLMLYHGRQSYRKNSKLILYNFYKNMILVLPQLWFGFMNGFSSANMFDPWIYQLYNVVYTSLPIIVFAIFDQQYTPKYAIENPILYRDGLHNTAFNIKQCLKWFISPALQAGFLCYVTIFILETDLNPSGHMMFFASSGMVIFAEAVIICNIKVIILSHEYSLGSLSSVLLSILLFYGTYFGAQILFKHSSIVNTLESQLLNPLYYAVIFLVVGLMCLIQKAIVLWNRLPTRIQIRENHQNIQMELPLLNNKY